MARNSYKNESAYVIFFFLHNFTAQARDKTETSQTIRHYPHAKNCWQNNQVVIRRQRYENLLQRYRHSTNHSKILNFEKIVFKAKMKGEIQKFQKLAN